MSMGKRVQESRVIELDDELNRSSTKETEDYWKKRSIYLLPTCVTDLNKEAYKPKAVSFGPYHHGEAHLKPMEEHKRRALYRFLKRSNKPLKSYIDSLTPVVQDLKDSYDSLDAAWQQDTNAFLQMMILDGCFMLEILRAAVCDDITNDYATNDPIFSNHGKLYFMPYIKRDMLMIENQLPMGLLQKILFVHDDKDKHEFLNKLLTFFHPKASVPSMECLHVLDVYRKNLLSGITQSATKLHENTPKDPTKTGYSVIGSDNEIIRSATELHEAGIKFRKSKTKSLKDISFDRGVLSLPLIAVDDTTESAFLNLIAFERYHVGAGNDVTSYIYFMDNIIDDAKDVSLLHSEGIIQNAIGSAEAVAKLFNSLSKDVTLDPNSSLELVHKKVDDYCNQRWHKWRASLWHTYFTNPWAMITLFAAIFLFALTIIQTIYTVYPYYHPA